MEMTTLDSWRRERDLTQYLGRQLARGRLILLLGAGFSAPFGLPTWSELIPRLIERTSLTPDSKFNSLSLPKKAEYLRKKFFGDDTSAFLKVVHDSLYEDYNPDFLDLRLNHTLGAVGALLVGGSRGRVVDVISFNYDDILERYLRGHGLAVRVVHGDSHWASAEINVYHPHGYLPFNDPENWSDDVILDRKSYNLAVGHSEQYWRQEAVALLRSNSAVLVGLSGEDDNLDSMLLEANKTHMSKEGQTLFWAVTFKLGDNESKDSEDEVDESDDEDDAEDVFSAMQYDRGVFPKVISDYGTALPKFLFNIATAAAEFRSGE